MEEKLIKEKLKPQGMELEEYMKLLQEGLAEQDIQEKQFSYSITQSLENPSDIQVILFFDLIVKG